MGGINKTGRDCIQWVLWNGCRAENVKYLCSTQRARETWSMIGTKDAWLETLQRLPLASEAVGRVCQRGRIATD
jgi:hypothetical protein